MIDKAQRTAQAGDHLAAIQLLTKALAKHPESAAWIQPILGVEYLKTDQPQAAIQALSYPATIKAFHFHLHQTDLWVPAQGVFQVALVDLRPDSPTYGRKNTLYVGPLKPWQILIPPGVGHGYKVVSESAGMLVYVTNRLYNPKDEGRIPHNDAAIAYDWELQHK